MSRHDVCAACGARVPKDALKCPHCGSTGLGPAAPGAQGSAPVRRGGSSLLVIFVAAAVLVAGGTLLLGLVALVSGSGAPSPEAAVAPTEGGDGGFARVKARGKLRAAIDPNAPPFFSASPGGGHEGFEFALLSAIAGQRGVEVEFVERDFAELLPAVRDGAADLAIGQLAPTPARGVVWSVSYLQYELCLVVAASSPARSLGDLSGATIGVYEDRAAFQAINAVLPGAWTRRTYSDYGYFDDLVAGRLDAVVYDCPLAHFELKPYEGRLSVVADDLAVRAYAVALPEGDDALRRDVNAVLRDLAASGLLARLSDQWLGTEGEAGDDVRRVTVRPGETLRDVAARTLGDESRAEALHELNLDVIGSDPDAVYQGMRLRVPE